MARSRSRAAGSASRESAAAPRIHAGSNAPGAERAVTSSYSRSTLGGGDPLGPALVAAASGEVVGVEPQLDGPHQQVAQLAAEGAGRQREVQVGRPVGGGGGPRGVPREELAEDDVLLGPAQQARRRGHRRAPPPRAAPRSRATGGCAPAGWSSCRPAGSSPRRAGGPRPAGSARAGGSGRPPPRRAPPARPRARRPPSTCPCPAHRAPGAPAPGSSRDGPLARRRAPARAGDGVGPAEDEHPGIPPRAPRHRRDPAHRSDPRARVSRSGRCGSTSATQARTPPSTFTASTPRARRRSTASPERTPVRQ